MKLCWYPSISGELRNWRDRGNQTNMSASMRRCAFPHFNQLRGLNETFCRTRRLIFLSKRRKSSIPKVQYHKDNQGRLIMPKPVPFPAELDVEPSLNKLFEADPLRYPKIHVGKTLQKIPYLPELLEKNIRQILATENLLNSPKFLQDVQHLQNVFKCRQPPMERDKQKQRFQEIVNKKTEEYVIDKEIDPERISDVEKQEILKLTSRKAKFEYGKRTHNWKPFVITKYSSIVYLAARLSANFTVLHQIFSEIQKRDPTFVPSTIYNMGSGTGSLIWAANQIWQKQVYEYYCVDSSSLMNDMALRLLSADPEEALLSTIAGVHFRQFPLSTGKVSNQFKMVVSAYMLFELPTHLDRLELVEGLWKQTMDYLVLVEHGTMAGYNLIMEARDHILQMGRHDARLEGHVFAPCTHDELCPKLKLHRSPCNFSVLYKPVNVNKNVNFNLRNQEEKYIYVVIKKGPRVKGDRWPRVLEMKHRDQHSHCGLCCPDGELRQLTVTRTKPSRNLYRCVRKSELGDFLPVPWPDKVEVDVEDDQHSDTMETDPPR